ncbi:phosphatidylethanolamine-binding protein [Rhodotorula diobovata]|uniref:Phosphatidylethanolamine-binding protein n=1 Tax=Rhodotorula diobovata TaxID=5288 RepID=A0A5C5G5P5_9BASI|nr:phosphatidylethanolamine-binding protein [Rhodotorula diobovata]
MQRSRLALRTCKRALSTTAQPAQSASYQPPVQPGTLPAYDHALAYIQQDRDHKLAQLEELKKRQADQAQLDKLEIEAWSNDPETRWRAKNGHADFSKPVYRHLAERAWRKDGDLAILMQRVTQMHVTPDLLPEIKPAADVRLAVGGSTIEPGVFTKPADTREAFDVSVQVYHSEERLYTLLVIDPDVPDEFNQTFTTFAHLLIPNVPLSATSSSPLALSSLPSTLSYVPPHPQKGTPYHRYTVLLLEQPSQLNLSAEQAPAREGFSVRDFVKEHGLACRGVSFFRQVWDKDVSGIYTDVLNRPEPRYGRPPKMDMYAGRPPKYEVV